MTSWTSKDYPNVVPNSLEISPWTHFHLNVSNHVGLFVARLCQHVVDLLQLMSKSKAKLKGFSKLTRFPTTYALPSMVKYVSFA